MVTTESADALAPNGARPSADTVLIRKINIFLQKFELLAMVVLSRLVYIWNTRYRFVNREKQWIRHEENLLTTSDTVRGDNAGIIETLHFQYTCYTGTTL